MTAAPASTAAAATATAAATAAAAAAATAGVNLEVFGLESAEGASDLEIEFLASVNGVTLCFVWRPKRSKGSANPNEEETGGDRKKKRK
ncbi:hypothetical protein ACSSS7_007608 [Eimeria intestinalis]